MRQLPAIRRGKVEGSAALLLVAALAVAPAFCRQPPASRAETTAAIWTVLKKAKPTVRGSLHLADCSGYPGKPCREYLIQALEYHWKDLRPNELKITDLDEHKVILEDRDVDFFLYMFPLTPSGELLATVWGTGTTNGVVRVYRLHGGSAKVVFYDGSRFTPQFIEGSETTANPFVLLGQGYVMRGNAILPTKTEIWQWTPAANRFTLRTTVPVGQRFTALAKLESEAKSK